jgi:hypothetical protein
VITKEDPAWKPAPATPMTEADVRERSKQRRREKHKEKAAKASLALRAWLPCTCALTPRPTNARTHVDFAAPARGTGACLEVRCQPARPSLPKSRIGVCQIGQCSVRFCLLRERGLAEGQRVTESGARLRTYVYKLAMKRRENAVERGLDERRMGARQRQMEERREADERDESSRGVRGMGAQDF